MNIRKKIVFQQAMNIKSEAKTKNQGVAGWKVGQTWHRNNCSHEKKYNKNIKTLLAKQRFSVLVRDRQLKLLLQHLTVWFDRKQSKYLSKELLLYDFCTRGRLMYERLSQTTLADHCINKPLKNLRWSYWRSIWRQNYFDMYHWGLGRSEKFHFDQFEN